MRRLFLLAVLACAPCAAHAQILSVYGTFSPLHASNVETGSALVAVSGTGGTVATNQEQYTSFFTPAFGGGVTLGILPIGPVHIGLDVRGSTHPGTVGADTALVGLRVGLKLPLIRFKPYVQASAGYLATRTTNVSTNLSGTGGTVGGTFTNQYLAYEGIAGVDYSYARFLDFRLLEIGVGQGLDVLGSSNSNATIFTLNTGVVVHF